MKKDKLLVLVGPTAVGKTKLSIDLANAFNGEIISGDSLQVYKGLDIGTAKVTTAEKQNIPHYLIDVIQPSETYSAYEFKKEAELIIEKLTKKSRLPIVVGGTGLYIQSLLFDFQLGSKEENKRTTDRRLFWENYAKLNGKEKLWYQLKQMDSFGASSIHMNNEKRVIRAIEVFEETGLSILKQQKIDLKDLSQCKYDVKLIGLETDRGLLYDRINERVDEMVNNGLLDEARFVFSIKDAQASQGIGYKEFFPFFKGEASLEDCINKVKQHSRQYAKRQLTWFKNRMNVEWFDMIQSKDAELTIKEEIKQWLNS